MQHVAHELLGSYTSSDAPLMEAGLDSLGAVEFRSRLSSHFRDAKLPETLIFDFPTMRQIEAYVLDTVSAGITEAQPGAGGKALVRGTALQQLLMQVALLQIPEKAPAVTRTASNASDVILQAVSCQLGGRVHGLTALWGASVTAQDAVMAVPENRWDELVEGRVAYGAFMHAIQHFDHKAFGLSPAEAQIMDPHQKLALESGYSALHRAGLNRGALMGSVTGVFAGVWASDYSTVLPKRGAASRGPLALQSSFASMLVGRLSFTLGLQGPSIPYDTACSSSLSASHAALCALQRRESLPALVLGVNVMCDCQISKLFTASGMTSLTGKSYTFDSRADGYARGEACCCAELELEQLNAWAVNCVAGAVRQDGRSASLTAPNGMAQQALLRAVLDTAVQSASGAFLLEAHGTGTSLGDPIEARAVVVVRDEPQLMAFMGCKANVGHTEPAAGLTGVLKLSQAMQRAMGTPNAQLRASNPHVKSAMQDGQLSSLSVQPEARPTSIEKVVGGVSSFGLNGTIAHVLLEFGREIQGGAIAHTALHYEKTDVTTSATAIVFAFRRRAFEWCNSPHPCVQRIAAPSSDGDVTFRSPALGVLPTPSNYSLDADMPLMEAGLQSQRVVRLAAHVRELSGTAFSAMHIFDYPTPRSIAAYLTLASDNQTFDVDTVLALANDAVQAGSGSKEPPRAVLNAAVGVPIEAQIPASTFQQHFLILHLLQPHVALYSLPALVKAPCHLPLPLVRAALHLLVHRHAVLRTLYALEQSRALQAILPMDGVTVPVDECADAEWASRTRQAMSTPFALTNTPPIRALLTCSSSSTDTRLLVTIDHIAADYASTLLMQTQLYVACVSLHKGAAPTLPPPRLQYADFALWQQYALGDGPVALEWWRAKLEGAPQLLQIPLDWQRSVMHEAIAGTVRVDIECQLAADVVALCTHERVSPLCCPLTVWAALMLHLSGQRDVVLGQPYSVQSDHFELQDVVGCYTTPIPVRITTPSRASSARQMLHDVYGELLQAIEHADVPLFQIVQAFGAGQTSTHNPLFQTIVQLLPSSASDANPSLSEPDDGIGSNLQGIDLFLNFVERDRALDGRLTFNAALFSNTTAKQLMLRFTSMLRGVVTAPDVHVHTDMSDMCMETKGSVSDELTRVDPASGRTRIDLIRQCGDCVTPFEIEDLLRRHPSVVDAIAFSATQRTRGEVVGAMVVLHTGHAVSLQELRASVTLSLANQWQPQVLVEIDEVPSDESVRRGLAARLRLPELPAEHDTWRMSLTGGVLALKPRTSSRDLVVAPATLPGADLVIDAVLDVVRKQTGNEQVERDTPLMDAGLNSLGAVQLSLQLEKQIGVTLPPTLIFHYRFAAASTASAASPLALSN